MQTIEELRKEVSEKLNKTPEELKGVSKKALRDMLNPPKTEERDIWTQMSDPNWTDRVMEEFEDHELSDGYPKVDGLRRVALKLLGPFSIDVTPSQISSYPGKGVTAVTVHITFHRYGDMRIGGAADVSPANTEDKGSSGGENIFMKHPTSTAESKAEGRAFRKALFMTKIYTAEEMNKATADGNSVGNGMVTVIKQVCHRKGFNPIKVASIVKPDIVDLDELTREEGRKVVEAVTDLERKSEEDQEAYK